ncbi:hypothetical protein [Gimesia chilikensis]|uniref:hypothetical protein n=1 Tax=Gimesia chilikensis TaxID=2605989 RepID=UPI0018D7811B|nr:hypothetical protein [Gimesia chilikensis]
MSKDKAEFISAPTSQGAEQEVGYCPISQIELGQRTLGTNPLREEVPENLQDPDPTFWREVHLQVADESQEEVTIQLLRPLGWIYAQNAWLGNKIPLELTELHVNGEAVVTYVGSCPPIRPGPGNVVTGKYIHQSADNLIDLSIEGENRPTGVTTNHPYWSVDRQCFLQAGDLKRGEHVETRYGPRQVVSLNPRGNQTVYNLEVHGEHVYRVGTLGTLVHNKAMKVSKVDNLADSAEETVVLYHGSSPGLQGNKFELDLAISQQRQGTSTPGIYLTDDFLRAAQQYGRGGTVTRTVVPKSFADQIVQLGGPKNNQREYFVNTSEGVEELNKIIETVLTKEAIERFFKGLF